MQIILFLKSLHQSETFVQWISTGGIFIITAIIFSETGLLLGFFLPGDSLLITAGVLAQPLNSHHIEGFSIWIVQIALTLAAICGDQTGFYLGHKTGDVIFHKPEGRLIKKKHLLEARDFYEKHGALAIVGCRFFPIFRTFVPFVAGVSGLPYRKYAPWSMVGGVLWIALLLWAGFFLGQTELANRLDKIILIVISVSAIPAIVGLIRRKMYAV